MLLKAFSIGKNTYIADAPFSTDKPSMRRYVPVECTIALISNVSIRDKVEAGDNIYYYYCFSSKVFSTSGWSSNDGPCRNSLESLIHLKRFYYNDIYLHRCFIITAFDIITDAPANGILKNVLCFNAINASCSLFFSLLFQLDNQIDDYVHWIEEKIC